MQVKIFESADMASGLKLVRKELGPDALILSTRTVRNGKLGLLGKPTIEITAAIDTPAWPKENKNKNRKSPQNSSKEPHRPEGKLLTKNRINLTVGDEDFSLDYAPDVPLLSQKQQERQLLTSTRPSTGTQDSELRGEVNELKNLVKQLTGQLVTPPTGHPGVIAIEPESESVQVNEDLRKRLSTRQAIRDPVTELLIDHGVDEITANTIADFTKDHLDQPDFSDQGKIRRFVIQAIEGLLEVIPPAFNNQDEQVRLALIGPTGVGKTTTLAKLAAHYLSSYSNSVALITIDTYRIAAVEQLKVYGEIMYLPVEVVISPEQLQASLDRHSDKSLILIDTAGRSPRDTMSIQELIPFLRPDLNIEKHLVLSATTRENELLDAIKRFEKVGIDRTIFTKVDECNKNGVILNVQIHNSAPLSYITNGQRVPEDLLQINRRSVAELILSHH
jgi:flagellar biosynthesis protein FlhF